MERLSKQERYFSGMPLQQDPRQPLPGEVPPDTRRKFILAGIGFALFSLGLVVGMALGSEAGEAAERVVELEGQLAKARARVQDLERVVRIQGTTADEGEGLLAQADRDRHEREGRRYAAALRKAKAQPAAELVGWFVTRWNELLDRPEADDRVGRRAQVLSQLVGGMARNIDPDDYVPWQAEFLSGNWLGELHFDLDGDGYPGRRRGRNPKDGFVDQSVCQIAMALNQLATDAQVLVLPQMRCDSPTMKTSLFLQGRTVDDALTELVRALKRDGFAVQDRTFKGTRMVLIGPGRRG